MGRDGRGQDRFIRRITVILTCGCLEAGTGWDGLAGDRAGSYADPCHSHLWLLGGRDKMGRVGRGQGRFIRRSLPFSPVAAWRQGQDGTGWQGTGPVHTQNPCHGNSPILT
jgi:hypothetical protein